MDRDEIQRRDFPVGRRGYDPAAVDEHLRRVADRFEAHADAPAPSLSTTTSEQVRQILQAAERSVSEMRARANEEASEHVDRVREAADGMLAKLDDLERELGNLLAALRASGERLIAGLADLQAEVSGGEPAAATGGRGTAGPRPGRGGLRGRCARSRRGRGRGRRAADRAQYGFERQLARGDGALPGRELHARRP